MQKQPRRITRSEVSRVLHPLHRTCAVTVHNPKTSALLFEKIYSTVDGEIPVELMTFRRDQQIVSFPAFSPGGPEESQRQVMIKFRKTPTGIVQIAGPSRDSLIYALSNKPDELCEKIGATGYRPVLCYPRLHDSLRPFQAGDYSFVVACLSNLGVIDEDRLTWSQVMEFRRDNVSRAHLVRLMNWLNQDMKGKTLAEIQDTLSILLENHRNTLKKWGMYLKAGVAACFALPAAEIKNLGVGLGVAAGGLSLTELSPSLALLMGGIPLGKNVIASVREVHSTLAKQQDAVAFFYGAKNAMDASREVEAIWTYDSPDSWTF